MSALTPAQQRHLERRLLQDRDRAAKALGRLRSSESELDGYRDHMADQGIEAMERETHAILATREGRSLHRDALHRLRSRAKTFGFCHATGRPIGSERLDALPHVRYCIDHKRALVEAAS